MTKETCIRLFKHYMATKNVAAAADMKHHFDTSKRLKNDPDIKALLAGYEDKPKEEETTPPEFEELETPTSKPKLKSKRGR